MSADDANTIHKWEGILSEIAEGNYRAAKWLAENRFGPRERLEARRFQERTGMPFYDSIRKSFKQKADDRILELDFGENAHASAQRAQQEVELTQNFIYTYGPRQMDIRRRT